MRCIYTNVLPPCPPLVTMHMQGHTLAVCNRGIAYSSGLSGLKQVATGGILKRAARPPYTTPSPRNSPPLAQSWKGVFLMPLQVLASLAFFLLLEGVQKA